MHRSTRPLIPLALALSLCVTGCADHENAPLAETSASPAEVPVAPSSERDRMFNPAAADRVDQFSYANFDEIAVQHINLDLTLDFEARTLAGTVILDLDRRAPDANRLVLDTDDLTITAIEASGPDGRFGATSYILGEDDPMLGTKLEIDLPENASQVRITYETSPGAAGLQWLTPAQTAGGKTPFVYSQAQAIHARSMVPLQDTPGIRITYDARIQVAGANHDDILVLMGAAQDEDGVRDGDFSFSMPQPIPPYLLAIAAGDIQFRAINDHIGVYAEDYIVDAATEEFGETPRMEEIAEKFYGEYRWGRYDMIVLPPSFPFGGMENPRLSFLTPTLVAGDRSLTNVVAHELAHSWSGNLVTNATWRDAWLNEGFTSYVENRIMEALYGDERARMERALDRQSLIATVEGAPRPALTRLKLPNDMATTDDAFSLVAYIKGMFFIKFLEDRFGRDAFDPFLEKYFDQFAFKAVVTEDFLHFLDMELRQKYPNAVSEEELAIWVFGEGMPATLEDPQSDKFNNVSITQNAWLEGDFNAGDIPTSDWTTHEWLHFIRTLPDGIGTDKMTNLDAAFDLSTSKNAEIAFAWYMKSIVEDYEPAFAPMGEFLRSVGRGKFIYPLYGALAKSESRREFAADVYADARDGYHPIAQRRIDIYFDGTDQ